MNENPLSHTKSRALTGMDPNKHSALGPQVRNSHLDCHNQKPLSRRAFLATAGAMTAGALLVACAPRWTGSSPRSRGQVQLVYQDWRTDWFSGMAQQMLHQFHAAHPNIHVFFTQDPDNLDENMQEDFLEDTAPDVLAGCCDFLPVWAQKGYLLDLRPYVEADLDRSTIDDWSATQYRAFLSSDGTQFALPKYHGALALYYNKDIFDNAGVEYPDSTWNHADYLQAMRQLLTERRRLPETSLWGSMVDISWERIQVHVNGWGGHFVDPQDRKRSMMSQPEALEAMQWIQDRIWGDHTMAGPLDVQNLETRQAFIQQRIAMVEDGSWALKDILENAPFRIGVAPLPTGPVRKVTLATTDGFAIYGGTRYPEAAWELLKFLISRDYGRAMARAHLLQPARASLVEEWVSFVRQQYPVQTKEMDIAAFAEGHIQGYSVIAEVFANMAPARSLAQAAWEQIFTLGQAPVSSLKEVSTQIEQAQ